MMKVVGYSLALMAGLASFSGSAQAGLIITTFAGGNGYSGNMFDVATGGSSLTITGVEVNLASTVATLPISIYTRSGSYVSHETSSVGWTLEATVSVASAGGGVPTLVNFSSFDIAANVVTGFYVTINDNSGTNGTMYYSNVSQTTTYSNADMTITGGIGEGGLFGSVANIPDRIWNGGISYNVDNAAVPEPASVVLVGLGLLVPVGVRVRRRRRS